jgi:hypothetical protein
VGKRGMRWARLAISLRCTCRNAVALAHSALIRCVHRSADLDARGWNG